MPPCIGQIKYLKIILLSITLFVKSGPYKLKSNLPEGQWEISYKCCTFSHKKGAISTVELV